MWHANIGEMRVMGTPQDHPEEYEQSLVFSPVASSSGTRLPSGAASLALKLRRMMTRFLLFHQTQDTTRTRLPPTVSAADDSLRSDTRSPVG
jgi:hypothetical protein